MKFAMQIAQITRNWGVNWKSPYLLYALTSASMLVLGISLTRYLSIYIEQRVFGLILFCALQLAPLSVLLNQAHSLIARLHWLSVTSYFVIAFMANTILPDWRASLAWLFYGYCVSLSGLIIVAIKLALRQERVRVTRS